MQNSTFRRFTPTGFVTFHVGANPIKAAITDTLTSSITQSRSWYTTDLDKISTAINRARVADKPDRLIRSQEE
jgi:hypothetical protein